MELTKQIFEKDEANTPLIIKKDNIFLKMGYNILDTNPFSYPPYFIDLAAFYKNRKLLFASKDITINVYYFDDKFIFQESFEKSEDILELAFRDPEALLEFALNRLTNSCYYERESIELVLNVNNYKNVQTEFPLRRSHSANLPRNPLGSKKRKKRKLYLEGIDEDLYDL